LNSVLGDAVGLDFFRRGLSTERVHYRAIEMLVPPSKSRERRCQICFFLSVFQIMGIEIGCVLFLVERCPKTISVKHEKFLEHV
jgi:hypothetical protein